MPRKTAAACLRNPSNAAADSAVAVAAAGDVSQASNDGHVALKATAAAAAAAVGGTDAAGRADAGFVSSLIGVAEGRRWLKGVGGSHLVPEPSCQQAATLMVRET